MRVTPRAAVRARRVSADNVDAITWNVMQRYFFTIRGRDRVIEEDPHGTYLPDVAAALSYAEHSVRELRKKSGCNDAALMMVVQDQARQPVWFVPFFPGS
jgi:hypothetical protein